VTFVATLQIGNTTPYAVEGVRVGKGTVGGASSTFESLAAQTSLADWARNLGWDGQEPLVVVAWSAGVFALRSWLRRGDDAEIPRLGLLLLDGLHGGSTLGQCDPGLVSGVVRFGQTLDFDRALVVTATAIKPPYGSTGDCAAYLRRVAPAATVIESPGDDAQAHIDQVARVGPELLRSQLLPWTRGESPGIPGIWFLLGAGALYLGWRWGRSAK